MTTRTLYFLGALLVTHASQLSAEPIEIDFSAAEGYQDGVLEGQKSWFVQRAGVFEVDTETGALLIGDSIPDASTAIFTDALSGKGAIELSYEFIFLNEVAVDNQVSLFRVGLTSSVTSPKIDGFAVAWRTLKSPDRLFQFAFFSNLGEKQYMPSEKIKGAELNITDPAGGLSPLLRLHLETRPSGDAEGVWEGTITLTEVGGAMKPFIFDFDWKPTVAWLDGPKYIWISSGQIGTRAGRNAVNIARVSAAVASE